MRKADSISDRIEYEHGFLIQMNAPIFLLFPPILIGERILPKCLPPQNTRGVEYSLMPFKRNINIDNDSNVFVKYPFKHEFKFKTCISCKYLR